jgi:hypothetical protein
VTEDACIGKFLAVHEIDSHMTLHSTVGILSWLFTCLSIWALVYTCDTIWAWVDILEATSMLFSVAAQIKK